MAILRLICRRCLLPAGLALGSGVSLAGPPPVPSPLPPRPAELQIKAAFLLNFAAFAKWPSGAFPDDSAPVVVAILGADPFGGYIDRMLEHETVDRRSFVVRRFPRGAPVGYCHILFVSESERARLRSLLAEIRGRPILTISTLEGFNAAGGMIRLVPFDGRIRFMINRRAAEEAGLTLSSRLLRLALVEHDSRREGEEGANPALPPPPAPRRRPRQ